MFKDLVLKNRSYRRFDESHKISMSELEELAALSRIVPSTANSQAIKLMLINSEEDNRKVFSTLGWAGMLKNWPGPSKGERPTAYIILLGDLSLGKNKLTDDGIIAQTLLLGAIEKGLGGCMLGNIRRKELFEALQIDPDKYSIDLVIALGKPIETVVIEDMTDPSNNRYYRDANNVHHVPKRPLSELIAYKSHTN